MFLQQEECLFQGKVEMEMELVSAEEAEERPAGQGQEEPNMNPKLDPPKYVKARAWRVCFYFSLGGGDSLEWLS